MKRPTVCAVGAVVCATLMASHGVSVVLDWVEDLAPTIVNTDRYMGPLIATQLAGGVER